MSTSDAAATAPRTLRAGRWDRLLGSESTTGWLFVSPAVLVIGLFGVAPIVWSIVLSFQSNDLVTPATWVGMANYKALLKDPMFAASVRRTIVYTLLFVPIVTVAALAVAVALNRRLRGMRFYRTAVFAPVVTSTVATAIMFNWLLDPDFGIVNALLVKLGLPAQGFFQSPSQALYCIVVMTVWGWLGSMSLWRGRDETCGRLCAPGTSRPSRRRTPGAPCSRGRRPSRRGGGEIPSASANRLR